MRSERWEVGSGSWIFGVIILDQVSKYFVRSTNFFSVVQNSALPFGINFPGVFNLVAVVAALILFIIFYKSFYFGSDIHPGATLIIAGAVSNIVDRAISGSVTDFINVGAGIINLADVAIYIGVVVLLIYSLSDRRESKG